ncbi:MAG: UvrD-helicase domain-containing protein, partial [Rudaea sp.]
MSIISSFRLTREQYQAVTSAGDLAVRAGAGSGKTRTLAARYLYLAERKEYPADRPPRIAAITFTEKAAREMRNRIRRYVQDWTNGDCPCEERDRWERLAANLDAARIGTIHSLCAAILRAHPAEAEIDPRFEVLDEGEAAALIAQTVDDALAWAVDNESVSPLFKFFSSNALSEILSRLVTARLETQAALLARDPASRANDALMKELLRYTGQQQVCAALNVLRDLRKRGELSADAGENLALKVEDLLDRWERLEKALSERDYPTSARILFDIRRSAVPGIIGPKTSAAKQAVKALREQYDDMLNPWLGGKKANDTPPDPDLEEAMHEVVVALAALFDHAVREYQKAKDRLRSLDFDDLEEKARVLLQRDDVRRRWQRQLDAVLVDEFQDTNERQREIVDALAGSMEADRGGRLFVVGDPKQSIYRFRGADVTVFRKVEQDIRQRNGKTLLLGQTFRAHTALVNCLNEMLALAMGCDEQPERPYYIPFQPLKSDRELPEGKISAPYVEFLYGLGEKAETARPAAAALLARRLCELQERGEIRWDQVACLFRASTGFPPYEQALEAAGIPFVTVAGRGFYDRPEIRDLLNILRALSDPGDDLALAGLLRSPAFGVSDAGLYQLRWREDRPEPLPFRLALREDLDSLSDDDRRRAERAREIFERLHYLVDRVSVAELIHEILNRTLYPAVLASAPAGARLERNVDKLLSDAYGSGLVRVREFLEYIETLRAAGAREGEAPAEAGGSVRLMSIHKAKGLEFPVVVLADASRRRPPLTDRVLLSGEDGVAFRPDRREGVPISYQLAKAMENDRADAEDLRLLYVAATRAQDKLIICAHQTRSTDVWLNRLADAAGVNLGSVAADPGRWHFSTLHRSNQQVGAHASAAA